MFNRKKSLFQVMNLKETVASTVIPTIDELYASKDKRGFIEKRPDNNGRMCYAILAFTEKELTDFFGNNPKDPEAGKLASALNDGGVKAIMTAHNISKQGFIGIIPDMDTLRELEDFKFVCGNKVPLHIGLVPLDFDEDVDLDVYPATTTLPEAFASARGDKTVELDEEGDPYLVDASEVLEEGTTDVESETHVAEDLASSETAETSEVLEAETQPFDSETADEEDAIVDEPASIFPDDDVVAIEPSEAMPSEDVAADDIPDEAIFGDDDEEVEDGDLVVKSNTMEFFKRQRQDLDALRDINLHIDTSVEDFKELFKPEFPFELFDETVQNPDDALEEGVAKIRHNKNVQLLNAWKEGYDNIYRTYKLIIERYGSEINNSLSIFNSETKAAEAYQEILEDSQKIHDDIIEARSNQLADIKAQYDSDREAYIQAAMATAGANFDAQHKRALELELQNDGSQAARIEQDMYRDTHTYELMGKLRHIGSSFMNNAKATALSTMNKQHQELMAKLDAIYKEGDAEIVKYVGERYGDEVRRANALASAFAYDERIEETKAQYEAAIQESQAERDRLREQHKAEVENLRAEYESRSIKELEANKSALQEQESLIEELRNKLDREMGRVDEVKKESERAVAEADDRARQRYEKQLIERDSDIETLRYQLKTFDDRVKRNDRANNTLMIVLAALGLMVGVIGTLFVVSNNTNRQIDTYQKEIAQRDTALTNLKDDIAELKLKQANGQ